MFCLWQTTGKAAQPAGEQIQIQIVLNKLIAVGLSPELLKIQCKEILWN